MATDLQGDSQTPILPPGKVEFSLFEFYSFYFWSFEFVTFGVSKFLPAAGPRILSPFQEQHCQIQALQPSWFQKINIFIKQSHYNLSFTKWLSQVRILRPDCPSKAINHLHGIRDREGNHASAEGVPENGCEDLWIFLWIFEYLYDYFYECFNICMNIWGCPWKRMWGCGWIFQFSFQYGFSCLR